MSQESVTFDLDGSREIVLLGGHRYLELINAGHIPLEPVPPIIDPYPQYASMTELDAATAAAVAALAPGVELGFAERTAPFTSTNTNIGDVTQNIPTLVVGPIVGTGRPVDVEFFAPNVYHSVAGTMVTAALFVNDQVIDPRAQVAAVRSQQTDTGVAQFLRRRIVLDDGVAYTFKIVVAGAVAGTATYNAATFAAMQLSVTQR